MKKIDQGNKVHVTDRKHNIKIHIGLKMGVWKKYILEFYMAFFRSKTHYAEGDTGIKDIHWLSYATKVQCHESQRVTVLTFYRLVHENKILLIFWLSKKVETCFLIQFPNSDVWHYICK